MCFSDVQYSDPHGGVAQRVDVKGSELRDLFGAIAFENGWAVEDLISNSAVVAGSKLECRTLVEQPVRWSFTNDPYIKVKLNHSRIVRRRAPRLRSLPWRPRRLLGRHIGRADLCVTAGLALRWREPCGARLVAPVLARRRWCG